MRQNYILIKMKFVAVLFLMYIGTLHNHIVERAAMYLHVLSGTQI